MLLIDIDINLFDSFHFSYHFIAPWEVFIILILRLG